MLTPPRDLASLLQNLVEMAEIQSDKIGNSYRSDFDLLENAFPKVDENAHTRILAGLIRIPIVCESFFRFLDRQYPGRGLGNILREDFQRVHVTCFAHYIDAYVKIGTYHVIIENKVKGAGDQIDQIDRYVKIIESQGVERNDIFVFYITDKGGMPSSESFNAAKKDLGWENEFTPGRFFALSYLKDILGWVNDMLAHDIWLKIKIEGDRDVFRSSLIQYRHYIEGPQVLCLREEDDGYADFRRKIVKELRLGVGEDDGLQQLFNVCTWVDYQMLFARQEACRNLQLEKICGEAEKRQVLKTVFYDAFGRVVPEDGFYETVLVFNGNGVASMGEWDQVSSIQVDVWYQDGDIRTYENAFGEFRKEFMKYATKLEYKEGMYNGHGWMRFYIKSISQLEIVISALGGKILIYKENAKAISPNDVVCDGRLDIVSQQIKAVAQNWCSEYSISMDDERWGKWGSISTDEMTIDQHYYYINGWAIQFSEGPTSEPVRPIDVFAKRGMSGDRIHDLQKYLWQHNAIFPYRCQKWDGRVFYRFPVPTKEYGQTLLKVLFAWRSKQGAM